MINWQKLGGIIAVIALLWAIGWGLFVYFFPSFQTDLPSKKTLNIDNSRGIIFQDSIIQGGADVSGSQEVEFNKTRITE